MKKMQPTIQKIFPIWDRLVKSPKYVAGALLHTKTRISMEIDIVTKQDLQQFKRDLIEELKELIGKDNRPKTEWLRSGEVRDILKISPGTLQNLRISGVLQSTKLGGMHYYRYEDIQKMLQANK
jgi:hypothetical protein